MARCKPQSGACAAQALRFNANMLRRLILILGAALLGATAARADCVVLLHGLARSEASLIAMEAALVWFDAAHGPREVVCMIEPGNAPSFALAARLGFAPMRLAKLPDGVEVQLFCR